MRIAPIALAFMLPVSGLSAQGTAADYKRAEEMDKRFSGLAVGLADGSHFLPGNRLWYRTTVTGGHKFVLVDIATKAKSAPFDHAKLAAAIPSDTAKYTAVTLPFSTFSFLDNETAIGFTAAGFIWRCALADYTCAKTGPAPAGGRGRGG